MKVETKYDIGQKVYYISNFGYRKEVRESTVHEITISNEFNIYYSLITDVSKNINMWLYREAVLYATEKEALEKIRKLKNEY